MSGSAVASPQFEPADQIRTESGEKRRTLQKITKGGLKLSPPFREVTIWAS
jgi:hypothetical protein